MNVLASLGQVGVILFVMCIGIVPQMVHAAADGRYWTEATTTAWSGTADGFLYAGSAIMDDALWAVLPDGSVWSSEDGIDWEMATSSFVPDVTVFWDFGMVSFGGELWIVGGDMDGDGGFVNTVWHSENGIEWDVATSSAEWEARSDMAVGVFDGKIWHTGGQSDSDTGLWYSEDGIAWTEATSTAPWGVVSGAELIEFDGAFWMLGGYDEDEDAGGPGVWSSPDGLVWTYVDDGPWEDEIGYFGATVFDEKLYVLGGYTGSVWSTEDGEEWTLMTDEAPWENAGGQDAQTFDGRLLVLGGDDPHMNTVWYSADSTDITFNTQGGSSVDAVSGLDGSTTTLPAAPTRSGYTFQNWNTAANGSGTSYAAGATYTYPATDTTLYAIWQAVSDGGGGGGNGARTEMRNKPDTSSEEDEATESPDDELGSLQTTIDTLKKKIADLMSQMQGESEGTAVSAEVRDLQYGDEGDDVRMLQGLLIAQGYAIPAGATSYFLSQTQTALSAYQKDKGILPAEGYFGAITRAQMKAAGLSGLWWY